MRIVVVMLSLLLCCQPFRAAGAGFQDGQMKPAPSQTKGLIQTTEKGAFKLELALGGGQLVPGPNSLDLTVWDKAGRTVEGAEIAVTPWMPAMGHGVWDKPVVTERSNGS